MCVWEKYNVGSSPDFSVGYVCCSIVLLAVFIRPGMVLSQRQRRHWARGGVTQEITINSIPQFVCRRTEWVEEHTEYFSKAHFFISVPFATGVQQPTAPTTYSTTNAERIVFLVMIVAYLLVECLVFAKRTALLVGHRCATPGSRIHF